MRLIIAGSRVIRLTVESLDSLLRLQGIIPQDVEHVLCGGAPGMDSSGEEWAIYNNLDIRMFRPEWTDADGIYNPRAGFERNERMAQAGTHLFSVHMDTSGSLDMIKRMRNHNKPVYGFRLDALGLTLW